MDTPRLEELIAEAEKLASVFGCWPSFHDAEIVELHFERGEINEKINAFDFPVLTVKAILFQNRVVDGGHCTLVALQFKGIDEFSMEGFNHQNAIFDLKVEPIQAGEEWSFEVRFDPAFGMGCAFKCGEIRVLNTIAWVRDRRTAPWLSQGQLAQLR